MRTVCQTVYGYEELSESAKHTALDAHRYCEVEFREWWDAVYEDATHIGAILGIEIDEIWFSGFSCQGDGACFEGRYRYRAGWKRALDSFVGGPDLQILTEIGRQLRDAQHPHFYQLEATVKHRGRYCHEFTTEIDVFPPDLPVGAMWESRHGSHEEIPEALRRFMRWIYRSLEREHDWLTSDEAVAEAITARGYEFDEDGNPA